MPQAPTGDSPTRSCPGRRAAQTGWGEGGRAVVPWPRSLACAQKRRGREPHAKD